MKINFTEKRGGKGHDCPIVFVIRGVQIYDRNKHKVIKNLNVFLENM